MRIAYISLHWPRNVSSGIGKKIQQQISTWQKLGHEVQFFSHMYKSAQTEMLLEGKQYPYKIEKNAMGFFQTEANRITASKKLIAGVRDYRPDIIYLRWAMYVYPLQKLFQIAPVIVEINTNDVEEHKLLGFIKSKYNQLTRSITLKGASGIVFSSRELANLPVFKLFCKPFTVISNSIDLSSISPLPTPINPSPHLVFSGTSGMAWHGVEKLLPLAEKYPDLVIDVIGYDQISGVTQLPENMVMHGYLTGNGYERVLAQADVAIGTLALHKKGMQEASPLKIRDCIARGIPCILPYQDTDLDDLDTDMILHIPNREDNIDINNQEIHDFVYKMRGRRVPRGLIQGRIDSLVKEKQRLKFFEEVKASK